MAGENIVTQRLKMLKALNENVIPLLLAKGLMGNFLIINGVLKIDQNCSSLLPTPEKMKKYRVI